jgi:hypothetical protein
MNRVRYFIILLLLLFHASCDFLNKPPDSPGTGVIIGKGSDDLFSIIKTLESPKGILPTYLDTASQYPDILQRDTTNFYEYFVYDKNRVIIILADDPLYYMIIDSPDFYFQLESEYTQMEKETQPSDKILNTVHNYHTIGDLEIGIFFTPKEIKFYEGRFQDSLSTTYVDPYRLYGAANKLFLYTPEFKEETIYTDFLTKWLADRDSVVEYTRSAAFSEDFDSSYITYYTKSDIYLNFTMMIGEDLDLTDELIGTNDVNYENQIELTRDFSIFLTVPLGNSQDSAEAYISDESASSRHGICVVIRGPQNYFKNFINSENMAVKPSEELDLSLVLKDNYTSNSIQLDWLDEKSNMNLWYKKEGEEYPSSPNLSVSGSSATLTTLERGNEYTFKLTETGNNANTLAETTAYITDLVITEINYWGTSYPGTENDSETEQRGSNSDDWIEIKNISSDSVTLSDLTLYVYNSNKKRDIWFSPFESDSGNYAKIDETLNPGERLVVSNDSDTLYFFKAYTPPNGVTLTRVLRGTKSGISIGESYALQLQRSGKTIQYITITGDYGTKAPFASMVMKSDGSWATSTVNTNTNPTSPLGSNTIDMLYNFATPGYAGDSEL